MKNEQKYQQKFTRALFAITAFVMVVLLAQRNLGVQLVYNHSESMEVGWYLVKKSKAYKKQDVVVFRQPEHITRCTRSGGKLFKRIIAVEGDRVCLEQGIITVNDELPFGKTDKRLHPKLIWRGCKHIERGQVFLATTHPQSCDSRFYGPLPQSILWGTARKL